MCFQILKTVGWAVAGIIYFTDNMDVESSSVFHISASNLEAGSK